MAAAVRRGEPGDGAAGDGQRVYCDIRRAVRAEWQGAWTWEVERWGTGRGSTIPLRSAGDERGGEGAGKAEGWALRAEFHALHWADAHPKNRRIILCAWRL